MLLKDYSTIVKEWHATILRYCKTVFSRHENIQIVHKHKTGAQWVRVTWILGHITCTFSRAVSFVDQMRCWAAQYYVQHLLYDPLLPQNTQVWHKMERGRKIMSYTGLVLHYMGTGRLQDGCSCLPCDWLLQAYVMLLKARDWPCWATMFIYLIRGTYQGKGYAFSINNTDKSLLYRIRFLTI